MKNITVTKPRGVKPTPPSMALDPVAIGHVVTSRLQALGMSRPVANAFAELQGLGLHANRGRRA